MCIHGNLRVMFKILELTNHESYSSSTLLIGKQLFTVTVLKSGWIAQRPWFIVKKLETDTNSMYFIRGGPFLILHTGLTYASNKN